MATPTKTKRTAKKQASNPEPAELRQDAWEQTAALESVFRYRGEMLRDDDLREGATTLEAMLDPEIRKDVAREARRQLKKQADGPPLTIRAQADALRDEVDSAMPDRVDSDAAPTTARLLAFVIVDALIWLPMLQQRGQDWPTFADSKAKHDAAIARVAEALEPVLQRGSDAERLVIAAMTALGDENAENLFGGRPK